MATSNIAIKITALPNIGNNIAPSTLIPVVNMAGVPTTQKANLQITGNLILAGAGTANFVPAALANLAYTVVNSNQANITRLGTLNINTFNVSGGVNGQFIQTDGIGNLSFVSGGGTGNGVVGGSNTQVQFNNAGDFGGSPGFTFDNTSNILAVAGNINFSGDPSAAPSLNDFFSVTSAANFAIVTDNANTDKTWRFGDDGNLTLPANTFAVNYANGTPATSSSIVNGNSNINIANANGNVVITSNGTKEWIFDSTGNLNVPGNIIGSASANLIIYSNAGVHEFLFGADGTFYAPDNVVLGGSSISIGPGANTLAGISNAVFIASSNSTAYIQGAITNVSDIGSADWAAYGHHGDDNGGWIDMGFNSSGYAGLDYPITGPGDGSLLVESYYDGQSPGGRGGNLIIATGSQGTVSDIIFSTGGFELINEFMRISNANNALELTRAGAAIIFNTGTDGNIDATDNINVIANGNIWTFGTEGTLTLPGGGYSGDYYDISSANGISIVSQGDSTRLSWVRPGATPIGNISYSTAFLDDTGISLTFTSHVAEGSYSDTLWKFGQDGSLTLPFEGPIVSNGSINIETGPYYIYGITGFNGGGADVQISLNDLDTIVSIGDNITDGSVATYQVTAITGTNPEWTITTSWTSEEPNLNAPYSFSKPGIIGGTWQFGNDGNITLPSNTSSINYANGYPYGGGGTYGDSNVATFLASYGSNTITTTGNVSVGNIIGNGSTLSALTFGNITTFTTAALTTDELYLQGMTRLNVTASGSSGYIFDQYGVTLNPAIYVTSGQTLAFNLNVTGHPFLIQTSASANYSVGLVHVDTAGTVSSTTSAQGQIAGTLYWKVPYGIVGNYKYQCSIHGGMNGNIVITDANIANIQVGNALVSGTVYTAAQPNITSVGTLTSISVTGNANVGNIGSTDGVFTGNISGNTNGFTIGYLNIPQVVASNATLALTDASKHFYSTTAGNFTLTVPNNATTSFATGTAISIVVQAAGNVLVNAVSGVTLYMAGNSTAANRVVGTYGMATLMKVATNTWFINGTGVS